MANHQPLSVKVVGGGIAGLTAAIALRQAGHDVEILERSSFTNEFGSGIALGPNAVKILQNLGIDTQKEARANKLFQTSIIKADTMEVLRRERIGCDDCLRGGTILVAHRVDLHGMLRKHAARENGLGKPASLRNGVNVIAYEPEEGLVRLGDGTTEKADLIIAADGVHSIAASIANEFHCPAIFTNVTQIRFMISTERILGDPETASILKDGPNDAGFYVSPGRSGYLVRYPCRESTMQNFGLYTLADHQYAEGKAWRIRSDREFLRQRMHGFNPVLLRLCDLASEVSLWRLLGRKPVAKCQRGRMVVIGDAAHPMLPHRGQGAVLSIEDAATLGVLFDDNAEPSIATHSVEEKLQYFEDIRQKHVSAIQIISELPLYEDTLTVKRTELLQFIPQSEVPVNNRDLREWLFKHDYRQAIKDRLLMI